MRPFSLNSILYLFCVLAILTFTPALMNKCLADVVMLKDGSILNGKVVKQRKRSIDFTNSYGSFTIKRPLIIKLIITKTYTQDLAIMKEKGVKINSEIVRKNFQAGLAAKRKKAKRKTKKMPGRNAISLALSYSKTYGQMQDVIPNGVGVILFYDFAIYKFFNVHPKTTIPSIRLDIGFEYFNNDPSTASSTFIGAGPQWIIPIKNLKNSSLLLAVLPEISYLTASHQEYSDSTITFSLRMLCGYVYTHRTIEYFINGYYNYIYDTGAPLHSVGVMGGVGYNFSY